MDNTNKAIKICRRISDIEFALEAGDQGERKIIELQDELLILNKEFDNLSLAI